MLRPLILLLSTIFLITIDLISKAFFVNLLDNRSIPLVGDLLQLHLVYNTGVAFSMPITGLPLQILTILLITGILVYYIRYEYEKRSRLIDTGFILILSGALSHSYERIRYEKVVDFIDLKYFAIFNFADIFITLGALIILLASWLVSVENRESRKS